MACPPWSAGRAKPKCPRAAFCGTLRRGAARRAWARDGSGRTRRPRGSTPCGCPWRGRSSRTCRIVRCHRSELDLAFLFLALIAFALLRWQAPLVTVGALGLPMMFLLYLHESEVDHDLPRRSSWPDRCDGGRARRRLGIGDRRCRRRLICRLPRPGLLRAAARRGFLAVLAIPIGAAGAHAGPGGGDVGWCDRTRGNRWTAS